MSSPQSEQLCLVFLPWGWGGGGAPAPPHGYTYVDGDCVKHCVSAEVDGTGRRRYQRKTESNDVGKDRKKFGLVARRRRSLEQTEMANWGTASEPTLHSVKEQ